MTGRESSWYNPAASVTKGSATRSRPNMAASPDKQAGQTNTQTNTSSSSSSSSRFTYQLITSASVKAIDNLYREKVDDDVNRMVEFIDELVMIRDNMLHIANYVFSTENIRFIISFLCTS